MSEFALQAHAALVVAKKNAMVYYLKPPVFTFGIIFPFFFYLAFAAGHNAPPETMAPGIVAMALLPRTIATLATAASVVAPLPLTLGIVLGSLSFAALGVLLAARWHRSTRDRAV